MARFLLTGLIAASLLLFTEVVNAASANAQCGGHGYRGSRSCPRGYSCTKVSGSYSRCLKSRQTTTGAATTTTSSSSVEYTYTDVSKPDSSDFPFTTASVFDSSDFASTTASVFDSCTSTDIIALSTGGVSLTGTPTFPSGTGAPSATSGTPTSNSSSADYTLGPYLNDTSGPFINDTSGAFNPVVGCPSVEYRLPIGKLQSDYPDVFNMYLVAMEEIMNLDESRELSYYEIAGIHGRPYIPFEHYLPPGTAVPQYGYCTHSSVLFATWHRPYMILLEQTLYAHAVKIAQTFTGSDGVKYLAAAKKVRLPYWDWAAEDTQSRIPDVVMQQTVTVVKPGPDGSAQSETIDNPLYAYKFKTDSFRTTYFANTWQEDALTTLRQPISLTESNNDLASTIMYNTYTARRQNTFNLFAINSFSAFSTDVYRTDQTPVDWTSVEAIHNEIHGIIGGNNGHMSYIDFSAFDPIFFLHHVNVDRLAAMYQAIKPGSNVQPFPRQGPTFVFPDGSGTEDIDTELHPFRHPSDPADDVEWTSANVSSARSIYQYGYAYPEVPVEYQDKSDDELSNFTTQAMQALYGPNPASAAVSRDASSAVNTDASSQVQALFAPASESSTPASSTSESSTSESSTSAPSTSASSTPESPTSEPPASAPSTAAYSAPAPSSSTEPVSGGFTNETVSSSGPTASRREWLAHVVFDPTEINSTFAVWATLGGTSSDPRQYLKDVNLVGGCASFTKKGVQGSSRLITGTIPLTDALLGKGVGLDPDAAVPYLREHLDWKIAAGTTAYALSDLPSLGFGVSSADVTYYDDGTKLPEYQTWETHYEITEGQTGGLQPNASSVVDSNDAQPVLNGTSSAANSTAARLRS